jgi:hypothetical protein
VKHTINIYKESTIIFQANYAAANLKGVWHTLHTAYQTEWYNFTCAASFQRMTHYIYNNLSQ